MFNRCPGQDTRNLKIDLITCRECGYLLEIFSDEIKTQCPCCKGIVTNAKLPSCIDWCSSARECLGEQKWKELRGG